MTWLVQQWPSDPLAGLERPRGDAAGLQDLGARYGAGAVALTSQAQHLVRMVGHVLGQAWSGTAAAACGAACVRSAQAVLVAAGAYERAGAALVSHGARLGAAQAEFDASVHLADEALAEERAHHAAAGATPDPVGGPSFDDVVWRSPLRVAARVRAEQAVADAGASARQAAAVLQETTAPLAGAPSAEGHWYDQATGFASGLCNGVAGPVALGAGLVGLNGDAGQNWAALGSGLGHAVTHPGDFAKAVVGWDDLSSGQYGHWLGELAPTAVAAFFSGGAAAGLKGADAATAAARAGEAVSRTASVARGLPGALKDVRVLIAETPEGLRFPAGLDTSSLRTLLSEAAAGAGRGHVDDVLSGLPKGRQPRVRTVTSDDELQRVYDELTQGGVSIDVPGYQGSWVELPDGLRVGLRAASKSGGRTIDIRGTDGRTWKVHIA